MNQLDGIKQFTTVVADSGDIESIRHYQPEDATTNPSLLLKAAGLAHFSHLIDDAPMANSAGKRRSSRSPRPATSWRSISVRKFLKAYRDASPPKWTPASRLTRKSINKARRPVELYREQGIDKSRILIKLASTGRHPRGGSAGERGDPLQPDAAVLLRPSACLRRSGRVPDFTVCRTYLRLVSGETANGSVRGGRRSRREIGA